MRGRKKTVFKLLLTSGADANAHTDAGQVSNGGWQGDCPLHFAVMQRHQKVVELLVARGADTNAEGEKPGDATFSGGTPWGRKSWLNF